MVTLNFAGFLLPVRHASFGELKWQAAINHSHPFHHAGEWQNNALVCSRRFKPRLVGLPIVCIGKINIDHLLKLRSGISALRQPISERAHSVHGLSKEVLTSLVSVNESTVCVVFVSFPQAGRPRQHAADKA